MELSQIATDDDKVHETVSVSPPGQVYGTERGQHRFVFEFPHPPADRDMDDTPSPVLMEREPNLTTEMFSCMQCTLIKTIEI